jgi:hypothetical protein
MYLVSIMIEEIDPNKAVDFIFVNASKFAKAKSERVYLEEFRKSKKALLMKRSSAQTIAAKEIDAYSDSEYLELIEGLKESVELEEKLRWDLIAAQARIEIWRTQQANNRSEGRATR